MSRFAADILGKARATVQARRPDPNARHSQLSEAAREEEIRRLDDNLALVRDQDPFAAQLFTITFAQAAADPDYLGRHMDLLLNKYAIEKGRTREFHLFDAIEEGPAALS